MGRLNWLAEKYACLVIEIFNRVCSIKPVIAIPGAPGFKFRVPS